MKISYGLPHASHKAGQLKHVIIFLATALFAFFLPAKLLGQVQPDAALSGLTISEGALTPAFDTNVVSYTDIVDNAANTLQITPATANAGAVIKVNGVVSPSGTAVTIPLIRPGIAARIRVEVNALNGDITVYNVEVLRQSTNALLSNLTASMGTLMPDFAPGINYYRDTVKTGNNQDVLVTVTPTAANMHATITVEGQPVASGQASQPIRLHESRTIKKYKPIHIAVTAQDGNTRLYIVKMLRPYISHNDNLEALTVSKGSLSPGFSPNQKTYNVNVVNSAASIQVTATVAEQHATITINGTTVASGSPSAAIPLAVGENNIAVYVLAQNMRAHHTYTIKVHRAAASGDEMLPAGITDSVVKKPVTTTTIAVTIYPNPASSTFNLKIMNGDNLRKVSLKVRDMQGNVVYQSTGNAGDTFTFGQNFAFGVYSAEVVNGSFVKQVKVIKALQ